MPGWNNVLQEINRKQGEGRQSVDLIRRSYLGKLHKYTKRNVIAYYSGWLSRPPQTPNLEIGDDDKNGFMTAVHKLDRSLGLDLILHTPGASPSGDSRRREGHSADYRPDEEGLASLRLSRLVWRHADIGEISRRRRENYQRWTDALAGPCGCSFGTSSAAMRPSRANSSRACSMASSSSSVFVIAVLSWHHRRRLLHSLRKCWRRRLCSTAHVALFLESRPRLGIRREQAPQDQLLIRVKHCRFHLVECQ